MHKYYNMKNKYDTQLEELYWNVRHSCNSANEIGRAKLLPYLDKIRALIDAGEEYAPVWLKKELHIYEFKNPKIKLIQTSLF